MATLLAACSGSGTLPSPDSPASGSDPNQLPGPEPDPETPPAATSPSLPTPTQTPVSLPPASEQLPAGVDLSNPGAAIRPVAVTSSSDKGANTAAKTIDGDATSRWESDYTDKEWIQFDFGAKTQIGYMEITWQNAYGKEYTLQVSDDGDTWYQLRYVTGGRGGMEEFMNLNSNVRYIRMSGVRRQTQYGYSIFEVTFKSPGSDNTLAPGVAASVIPFPADGSQLAPPPPESAPLEGLQFTLPDGTLVTRWGTVGRSRHGRERGEAWNEIGYGPNETVDAAGNPADKGPGDYLPFVKNYFKPARTWGVEIIDNSRVPGVTKPTLRMNQYFKVAQKGGGEVFFRGFDRPGVTGYGWMTPGQLVDPSTYKDGLNDIARCPPVPYPPEGRLLTDSGLNDGCSLTVDSYPQHSDLSPDANGVLVPNGTTIKSRPLQVDDVIEVSTSFFSTPEAMAAIGDTGRLRYYTNEWTYVMGRGLVPQYGVQPRLMNAPLPPETWQGGLGSVSYDYADNATFMFQQPQNDIGMQNMQRFVEGRRVFHTNMTTGEHTEAGNDVFTDLAGLQGRLFNQQSCFGCHINNGRSMAPQVINQRLDTQAVFTADLDANGQQVPSAVYGMAAQMNSQPSAGGVTTYWGTGVYVARFDTRSATLSDGTAVQLSRPALAFEGPTPARYSLRSAPPVIGMGLLEAIPDAAILAGVRAAPDADGVKGTANFVYDPETKAVRLGRFGWKASKVSVRHQIAGAELQDMSVTSPIYPTRSCMYGPAGCSAGQAQVGITNDTLVSVTRYVSLLGVPAQRSLVSGFPKGVSPLPYLDVNPAQVAAGARMFETLKCTSCHVKQWQTGTGSELAEVRNQTISPYTDMLLHDMGPDLDDGFVEGQASGSMWRTTPLWGVGYTERVAGGGIQVGYLHDSRARTLTEAVLWHGGEAAASRQRFQALSTDDRTSLLAFLGSL